MIFIYTYYKHLGEIVSGAQESQPRYQEEIKW